MNRNNESKQQKPNPFQLNISFDPPARKPIDKPCAGSCDQSGEHCHGCGECSDRKAKPDNSLQLTGEVLFKMVAGYYTEEQLDGAWDVVKSLLKKHFSK